MNFLLKNWKTTAAGAAMILSIVPKLADPTMLTAQDLGALVGGVGLLLAKDHDVSHTQP